MAGYINSIFSTLQNYNITIHIGGACWGRNGQKATAQNLIDNVFFDVRRNIEIKLYNHYKTSHQYDTLESLLATGFTNIHSYGDIDSIGLNKVSYGYTEKKDHAKFIAITLNSKILFFMIGSSNFSYNTYVKNDGNTDQLDLSFILGARETNSIVRSILNNETNQAMHEIHLVNEDEINTSVSPSTPFDFFYQKHTNDFINTPFICSKDYDLLEEFFSKEIHLLTDTNEEKHSD
ncbi:hypothetical protein ACT5YT_05370 [Leuconostoc suionicum]|uniref:hypothetical protein n=1 Tax=Leuconostoc suionicum TaxID=1511761 RepID=UPI004035498C